MNEKKQKNKIVRKRHQRYVSVANVLIGPFLRRKVGFKSKRLKIKEHEPFLLVSNHVTAFDPILVTSAFNRQIYYVSSELIFSKGIISRMLEHAFAPIPKAKSQNDVTSVKNMITVVKEGGNIGVFVEGNSTMNGAISNVPTAIGKLVLLMKIPLVIYNLEGGYLSNPRWSSAKRKGYTRGHIKQILQYEDYKHMSADEINEIIINGINVNAYDPKYKHAYPGKRNAEGLHRLLFTCPKCHGVNTVHAKKNTYSCHNCNFKMDYDEYGYLHSTDFKTPQNTIELDHANKVAYQEIVLKDRQFSVSVPGKMTEVFRCRRKHFGKAVLTLSREGLDVSFNRKNMKDWHFSLDEIDTLAIQQKEVLVIYPKHEQTKMLLIKNTELVSSYQLLVTMQILKNELLMNDPSQTDAQKLSATAMGL